MQNSVSEHEFTPAEQRRLWRCALARGGDFAEVFLEHRTGHVLELDRGKIHTAQTGVTAGAGVRVLSGMQTGYAHTGSMRLTALLDAAAQAAFIAGTDTPGGPGRTGRLRPSRPAAQRWPDTVPAEEKAALLREADAAARGCDARIVQVTGVFADRYACMTLLNSDGLYRRDHRRVHNLVVSCIAEGGGQRNVGRAFLGGRTGFELYDVARVRRTARRAARQALQMLEAVDCPAGEMPVVIGNGWGGVLVHEAVGHGLESDFIRKGNSLYTGRLGKRVASPLVTIIDDGTVRNGRGTQRCDDEGASPQRTVLIRNGVLETFLYDRLNARLMQAESTGNGRRQSFEEYPIPRMTNTFIDRGDAAPADLLASVKRGLYAKQLGGGQVDITSGNFVFEVSEGWLIENGRLTAPVRGATLIGNGPEAMQRVTGVGRDLVVERATGTCGKDGQSVPVGVGQPTILVARMTVGGTRP